MLIDFSVICCMLLFGLLLTVARLVVIVVVVVLWYAPIGSVQVLPCGNWLLARLGSLSLILTLQ